MTDEQRAQKVGPGRGDLTAAMFLCALLLRIVNDARRGSPFLGRNATRLRVVGVAMVVGFLGDVVGGAAGFMATDGAGFRPQTSISFGWLGVAAAFFALAQVWSQGVRLAADADLTI